MANIVFAFCSPLGYGGLDVFNRWAMSAALNNDLSCTDRERLEFELLEVRTRGQYLTRLRALSAEERAEWDRRERAATARLVDHDLEHGCHR
jgi:hypothetical protein